MTSQQLTSDNVQQYVDTHSLSARLIGGIGHTPTVPAAAEALGVHPDQIVKTLLFLVKLDGAAPEERTPIVVISNGTNLVDKKAIALRFGVGKKRVRLATPEVVLATLGYPAGGVPPFAHRQPMQTIVDQSVVDLQERFDDVVYAGGGDDETMMELRVSELVELLQPEVLAVSQSG